MDRQIYVVAGRYEKTTNGVTEVTRHEVKAISIESAESLIQQIELQATCQFCRIEVRYTDLVGPNQKDDVGLCSTAHEGEVWNIDINGDLFTFTRRISGTLNEVYGPVYQDMAAVYAAAIIQGFDPPRQLKEKDDGLTAHQVHRQGSDFQP
ncbi:hypothetical protein ACUVNT_002932 [Yersinia enterocolitica]